MVLSSGLVALAIYTALAIQLTRHLLRQQVPSRMLVLSLMLLWRKGIIRFHDNQPKAAEALPGIFAALHSTPVRWVDCHNFAGE